MAIARYDNFGGDAASWLMRQLMYDLKALLYMRRKADQAIHQRRTMLFERHPLILKAEGLCRP